jgi:hypothetical protein
LLCPSIKDLNHQLFLMLAKWWVFLQHRCLTSAPVLALTWCHVSMCMQADKERQFKARNQVMVQLEVQKVSGDHQLHINEVFALVFI